MKLLGRSIHRDICITIIVICSVYVCGIVTTLREMSRHFNTRQEYIPVSKIHVGNMQQKIVKKKIENKMNLLQ